MKLSSRTWTSLVTVVLAGQGAVAALELDINDVRMYTRLIGRPDLI